MNVYEVSAFQSQLCFSCCSWRSSSIAVAVSNVCQKNLIPNFISFSNILRFSLSHDRSVRTRMGHAGPSRVPVTTHAGPYWGIRTRPESPSEHPWEKIPIRVHTGPYRCAACGPPVTSYRKLRRNNQGGIISIRS